MVALVLQPKELLATLSQSAYVTIITLLVIEIIPKDWLKRVCKDNAYRTPYTITFCVSA
uniref:AlNc14C102G6062 protein n=1 Tax=Albugo laibachii Nc14 TaxID=890382 RepID=F0WHM5_9STRA|nr:AlNc14C102G6062 [Albugo laibachii Nc14]|eukprot:CCA20718.1 AlNc14C102G6062 [Albugo laibachii Nc14]